jgi:hypothetical protein
VYEGEIDLAARRAWVSTPAKARLSPAVDRILAWVLMQALPRAGTGVLLHALGLERGGQGYAFAGATGSGKSTLAGLAKGDATVLCDENVVLATGPGGGVDLVSTPLWGMSTPRKDVKRMNRRVPLAALFVLRQAPEFGLRRLSDGEAVGQLLGTEKVATERVDSAMAWLGAIGVVLAAVPAYELSFRADVGLWALIEDSLAAPT